MSALSVLFTRNLIVGLSLSGLLAGCAPIAFQPPGPSVTVLPAPNKPFDIYVQDHATCKQFAAGEVAGAADQANIRTLADAGTNMVLGAAIGGAAGGGVGAGIGAASGAIGGGWFAANDTPWGVYGIQNRYDAAFIECMYAKGNQIPRITSGFTGYPQGWGSPYRYYGAYASDAPTPYPTAQLFISSSGTGQ